MTSTDHRDLIHRITPQLGALKKSQAGAMGGFYTLAQNAMADGALSARHKELVALAIGIAQGCSGCIAFHVKALHRLGCTRAEFEELLVVSTYMGGGPALMYAAEAMDAWETLAPPQPAKT